MWSYRLSGGYFNSDAFARPTGRIPLSKIPGTDITTGGAFYPPYHNYGTSQPKFDFRLDQDLSDNSKLTYTAGVGFTSGTTFYPAGVDEIERGVLGYGKANYANGNFKLQFFTNIVDGKLLNLFAPLPGGGYAEERFDSKIYDVEAGHAIPWGNHQLVNFGANFRHNDFDITTAPQEHNRNEGGIYIQDEIFFRRWRFVVGARVDKYDVVENPVFSPRMTAMFYAVPTQSIRVSFNRAFRAPALIENFLESYSVIPIELPTGTFLLPLTALGNRDLKEESINAFEISYIGQFHGSKTTLGASNYLYNNNDNIVILPTSLYGPDNPPPGWPLPPRVVPPIPQTLQFQNVSPLRNQGFEIAVDHRVNNEWRCFANYSYQVDPEILDPEGSQTVYPVTSLNFGIYL